MNFEEAMELLGEYAVLEGSESGETWDALVNLGRRLDYLDEGFAQIVREFIIKEAEDAKDGWIVREETKTIEKTVRYLEWNGA